MLFGKQPAACLGPALAIINLSKDKLLGDHSDDGYNMGHSKSWSLLQRQKHTKALPLQTQEMVGKHLVEEEAALGCPSTCLLSL